MSSLCSACSLLEVCYEDTILFGMSCDLLKMILGPHLYKGDLLSVTCGDELVIFYE